MAVLRSWVPGKVVVDDLAISRTTESSEETPSQRLLSATSQGFVPPPPPAVLRRSLILSAAASALGAAFFTVIQGTVFNFFLEDLSLRDRLPFFMGLWCLAASPGMLVGSWIQGRWGHRRGLFMWASAAAGSSGW